MGSKVRVVFLLPLLGVALALAGGTVEAGLAGTGPYAAALQMMAPSTTTSTMGFEVRRRVLSNISPSSLNPNRAACLRSCPASGGAYTGRGCQKVYQCSG
ncbi:hypothetical protein SETIT_7G060800v2 [Setaria italica]|uniref:Uncharacterized protein n=1 Tax=Setaria italica TaxID=4555 RepID=K3YB41_SETIT|nr:uncharacterized protein LOC101768454 [Setaria italica]RCV33167.1 hypothetical protein SETIT_7G060800v2 [Setaria italica]